MRHSLSRSCSHIQADIIAVRTTNVIEPPLDLRCQVNYRPPLSVREAEKIQLVSSGHDKSVPGVNRISVEKGNGQLVRRYQFIGDNSPTKNARLRRSD